MLLPILFGLSVGALACPQHGNYYDTKSLQVRQLQNPTPVTSRPAANFDWSYNDSYNWGAIKEAYDTCLTGTQQSPIELKTSDGFAKTHKPDFRDVKGKVRGNFYDWGYGPAFTIIHEEGNFTSLPSVTFDDQTVYLIGWHVHSPADHVVDGDRPRAELHYVFYDEGGEARSVFGMRIDSGSTSSAFFAQLPTPFFGRNETTKQIELELNLRLALKEVNMFARYWTYEGSLTTPPCTEGDRWFISGKVLRVANSQMREILRSGSFSSRVTQRRWEHNVNV
ncbi:Hypothetical protein D9617_36g063240 [Elsinoe fawcettii]|nr:Hypothetical protein D9617_36g063240 [Elsinoe fawcettii]